MDFGFRSGQMIYSTPSQTIAEKGSIAAIPAAGGKPVKSFNVVPSPVLLERALDT
jgi:hypothetical protein